jgi:hypothetical protein
MTLHKYTLEKIEANKANFPVGEVCYVVAEHSRTIKATVVAHLAQSIRVGYAHVDENGKTIDELRRTFKASDLEEIGSGSTWRSGPKLITQKQLDFRVAVKKHENARRDVISARSEFAEKIKSLKPEDDLATILRTLAEEYEKRQATLAEFDKGVV